MSHPTVSGQKWMIIFLLKTKLSLNVKFTKVQTITKIEITAIPRYCKHQHGNTT